MKTQIKLIYAVLCTSANLLICASQNVDFEDSAPIATAVAAPQNFGQMDSRVLDWVRNQAEDIANDLLDKNMYVASHKNILSVLKDNSSYEELSEENQEYAEYMQGAVQAYINERVKYQSIQPQVVQALELIREIGSINPQEPNVNTQQDQVAGVLDVTKEIFSLQTENHWKEVLEVMNNQNYYEMLGISPDEPTEYIQEKYENLLKNKEFIARDLQYPSFKKLHQKVLEAFETLTDPKLRAAYDKQFHMSYARVLDLARAVKKQSGALTQVDYKRFDAQKSLFLYETLGVSVDATEKQIKEAYRRLSLQYHPDRNVGDNKATSKFQEISEAYQVLSDPRQRAEYDAYLAKNTNKANVDFDNDEDYDLEDNDDRNVDVRRQRGG